MRTKRSPKFKEERNRKIYELYADASKRLSTSALARMFQISQTRVWAIIKDWQKKINEESLGKQKKEV